MVKILHLLQEIFICQIFDQLCMKVSWEWRMFGLQKIDRYKVSSHLQNVCLDRKIEMAGDVVDKQVEWKWTKTTALRNAASHRASMWEGRFYSAPLSSIGKEIFDPEEKIALDVITEKFLN